MLVDVLRSAILPYSIDVFTELNTRKITFYHWKFGELNICDYICISKQLQNQIKTDDIILLDR